MCVVLLLLFHMVVGTPNQHDPFKERTGDEAGWAAIRELHKQMDDDQSGTVTLEESTGFVKEELEITENERLSRRQQTFHQHNDNYITVEDLWKRWAEAIERNWTSEEMIYWLENVVELPQYVDSFIKNEVDGRTLPRIASSNASFLLNILGVQNPVHRRKLQLKAMDVVLFGYKKPFSSVVKDVLLLMCILAVMGAFVSIRWQKSKSARDLSQLSSQMAQLTAIETDFNDAQSKLAEERQKKQELSQMATAQESESKKQMVNLLKQLKEADKKITEGAVGLAPLALQPLLKRTCDKEMTRLNELRLAALEDMKEAMLMVEKLRRKQSSMMTSLRFAIGSDNETNELDQQITAIKSQMDHSGRELEESQLRWSQIESLCGFAILSNSGLAHVNSRVYKGIGHIPMALSSAFMAVPSAYSAIKPSTSYAPACSKGLHDQSTFRMCSVDSSGHSPPTSLAAVYSVHTPVSLQAGYPPTRSMTTNNLQENHFRKQANEEVLRPSFHLDDTRRTESVEDVAPTGEVRRRPHLGDVTNNTSAESQSQASSPNSNSSENGTNKKIKGLFGFAKKAKEKK